jgi:hypothetical protein
MTRRTLLALTLAFLLPLTARATEIPPGYIRGQVFTRGWTHPAPNAVVALYDRTTGLPVVHVVADNQGRYEFTFKDFTALSEIRVYFIGAEWKGQYTAPGQVVHVVPGQATWYELQVG